MYRACGGLAGHYFSKINIELARIRAATAIIRSHPIAEVALVAFLTSITSYLVPFMRVPTFRLVQTLFTDCTSVDLLGICEFVSDCGQFYCYS